MKRPQDFFGNPQPYGKFRDPITAIMGGISAGTSLIGGIMGHNAASNAAKMQQQAAQQAGQQVTDATNAVNPTLLAAANTAGVNATAAAGAAGAGATQAAGTAATGATDAATKAAQGVSDAATSANKLLDPYAQAGATAAGVLNQGIAAGGDFNKAPTMADLQIDPGYAFRQQQAIQQLTRSAAAHGAVDSGGYQKDLNDYVQGSASQEYQNAFNRFETSTQNRFANVSGVANAGQNASNTQGSNLIGAATYGGNIGENAAQYAGNVNTNAAQYAGNANINASQYAGNANINATDLAGSNTIGAAKTSGDYLTQGANAAAAGQVAGTNALTGGITGAVNAGTQAYQFNQLVKNPAANYFNFGPKVPAWQGPAMPAFGG